MNLVLGKFLVRFADLIPDTADLMEACAFGPANQREFSIVGGPVAYAAAALTDAEIPGEVAVAGLRQSPGCAGARSFRDAAEVLIAHLGRWRIALGLEGDEDRVELSPGDVVSVPSGTYRSVERLDDGPGFLFIVRSTRMVEPDPTGPAVFTANSDGNSQIVSGGRWFDFSSGVPVLKEAVAHSPPADTGVVAPQSTTRGLLSDCMVRAAALAANAKSPLAADGVEEAGIIATQATRDGFGPGPMKGWWPHGFSLRCLTLESGAYIPMHSRREREVILLQEGTLEVSEAGGAVMMGAGDTLIVPVGVDHALRNTTSGCTRLFIVRESEDPAMPLFHSMPLRD